MVKSFDSAKDYRDKGFSVIPLSPRDKQPLVNWKKFQKKKANHGQITSWWTQTPEANVGIVTGKISRLVVIDCDSEQAVDDFLKKFPEAKCTRQTKTGKGVHFYFRWSPGIRNSAGTFQNGIDVRSDGGYVVAPPSIHPNGTPYKWLNKKSIEPLPQKIKELLTRSKKKIMESRVKKQATEQGIHEGRRNSHLTSLAGSLHAKGMSPEAIMTALRTENEIRCRPPLASAEVQTIVESISRYVVPAKPEELLTEAGNARRFAAQHRDKVRYCHIWRNWLLWDGTRWRKDEKNEVYCRAKDTVKTLYAEAGAIAEEEVRRKFSKHAMKSEGAYAITAMLSLAQSEPSIAITPSDLDKSPWALNVQNGTIDLKTGKLESHDKHQLITKLAPINYQPNARCPQWLKFLNHVMSGKQEMIEFLQRAIGYSLTGDVSEQKLFFLYGTGANGKSTFLNVLQEMLGDYAKQAAPELLVTKYGNSHPTEVADLQGSRFVVAVEVEEGKRMAEALVKQMTGGDKIKARFMHQNFFEFQPTHKLFLAANHRPIIHGTDDGIWRRIMLVPFTVTIPESKQDKRLLEKLRKELPGILAWAVKGCLKWQAEGLHVPVAVSSATSSYRSEMDTIETFLNDRCLKGNKHTVRSGRLYAAYTEWCDQNGERFKYNQKSLSRQLQDRGFESRRRSEGFIWIGLGLKRDNDEDIAA